jgi:hypothetical protein
MSHIEAAWNKHCEDAVEAKGCYLSLYEDCPYYGGPEEGGWWGSDLVLIESKWFSDIDAAEAVREIVLESAKGLDKAAKDGYHRNCASEMDWLEARGLDADFLPEPDGPSKYKVFTEDRKGELESTGSRHYE